MDIKQKEIILAGGLADALGYKVEFDSWEVIKSRYGEQGVVLNMNQEITVSDDTQMTLFCLNAVKPYFYKSPIDKDELLKDISAQFKFWLMTQVDEKTAKNKLNQFTSLYERKAPGNTCLKSLMSFKIGSIERSINSSPGCGAIMRVAPIAFLNISNDDIFILGCKQGALTHGSPLAYLSSGFFSVLLKELMNAKSFEESYKSAKETSLRNHLNSSTESEPFYAYLRTLERVFSGEGNILRHNDLTNDLGRGFDGHEALGIAYYSAYKAQSFEDCLDISINHSGDSDSTGSLAAQLYVAKHGLPDDYKNILDTFGVKDVLDYLFNG